MFFKTKLILNNRLKNNDTKYIFIILKSYDQLIKQISKKGSSYFSLIKITTIQKNTFIL